MMRQERAQREVLWRSDGGPELTGAQDCAPAVPPGARPARQRVLDNAERTASHPRGSRYQSIARISGHLAGLMLSTILWLTGAFFTVVWLRSVAAFGVGATVSSLGAVAYGVPLLVTAIEAGLWPGYNVEHEPASQWQRTSQLVTAWIWPSNGEARVTNTIWLVTIAWSTYTTAAGLVLSGLLDGLLVPQQWMVGVVIGTALDLAPEKLGRSLVRSLLYDVRRRRRAPRPRRSQG